MAGAMMCDGFSWASWMMYSPRSVSTGLTPAASRASFSSISSVAMDLLFTAMRTPRSRQRRRMMSRASSPVAAQPLHVVGEALEMAVEVLERRLLDGAGAIAQRFARRVARKGLLAETDELRGGDGECFLEVGVTEGGVRPLRKGCAELGVAHALPSGSSTCAR